MLEYCQEIPRRSDRRRQAPAHGQLKRRGVDVSAGFGEPYIQSRRRPYVRDYVSKGKERTIVTDMAVSAVGRRPVLPEGPRQGREWS